MSTTSPGTDQQPSARHHAGDMRAYYNQYVLNPEKGLHYTAMRRVLDDNPLWNSTIENTNDSIAGVVRFFTTIDGETFYINVRPEIDRYQHSSPQGLYEAGDPCVIGFTIEREREAGATETIESGVSDISAALHKVAEEMQYYIPIAPDLTMDMTVNADTKDDDDSDNPFIFPAAEDNDDDDDDDDEGASDDGGALFR